VAEEQQQEPAG